MNQIFSLAERSWELGCSLVFEGSELKGHYKCGVIEIISRVIQSLINQSNSSVACFHCGLSFTRVAQCRGCFFYCSWTGTQSVVLKLMVSWKLRVPLLLFADDVVLWASSVHDQ